MRALVLERDESSDARRQGYGVTLSETNAALEVGAFPKLDPGLQAPPGFKLRL